MRIGVVTQYMLPHQGGIEQVAEHLFHAYTSRGFEVRWVASRVPLDAPAREDGRVRVPCWNGLERFPGIPVPVWGYSGVHEVAELCHWADVLHVHDCLYPSSALAMLLARRNGKPVLLSQHIGFIRYRLPGLNAIEWLAYQTVGRAVLRSAAHVVFATPRAEDYIPRLLRQGLSVSTIPNGVDTARFKPPTPDDRRAARARLKLPTDAQVILFAGRLVARKGVDIILEVAKILPTALVLVVGDGPLRHLVKQATANIAWRPWVTHHSMVDCYQAADCLVLPSLDEGLPAVVQEALACDLPAVVSEGELYAAPLVKAGVCMTASRTAEAMAASVHDSLSGRHVLHGGRVYAEAEWSRQTMMDRYVSLLESLAARMIATN